MRTLLIVDVQNDFIPGGALQVPEGDQIIPIINSIAPKFDLVVATQDWHPADHKSFAENHPDRELGEIIDLNGLPQILWPVHCVQGTEGAEFVKSLHQDPIAKVFQKGADKEVDSYSGFYDNDKRHLHGRQSLRCRWCQPHDPFLPLPLRTNKTLGRETLHRRLLQPRPFQFFCAARLH